MNCERCDCADPTAIAGLADSCACECHKARAWSERTRGGTSFVGSDVEIFRATVMAHGLKLYARTGMKPNRAYTPSAMMRCAREITGQRFKARDYTGASAALLEWANARKGEPRTAPRPAPAHTCHYPGSDPALCRGCKG